MLREVILETLMLLAAPVIAVLYMKLLNLTRKWVIW